MNSVSSDTDPLDVRVENIGGIDETAVSIPPGVTVLVGRNATNRTSFLKSMMAVLGSENVPLKASKSSGRVECVIDGTTYERTATRQNETIVTTGNPYSDAVAVAESFAFLLESNDARRAVERGDDLRKVVIDPLDVSSLRGEIRRLERRREAIDERLDRRSELETRSRDLAEEIESVESDLDEARDRYSTVQSTIDAAMTEGDDATDDQYQSLVDRRNELEEIRYDRQTVEAGLSALREEQREKRAELEDLEPVPDADELQAEVETKRDERQRLESRLNDLQRVVRFNRRRLKTGGELAESAVTSESNPTAGLVRDRTTCWTCGSTVDTEQIRSTVSQLESYRRELMDQRDDVDKRLTTLQDRQDELATIEDRVQELRDRLREIENETVRRKERLESLIRRERELEDQIEQRVEDGDRSPRSDSLLEAHGEASRLEATIDHLETERNELVDEHESVTEHIEELSDLETRRHEVTAELTDQRETIAAIENRTIESFNAKMDEILDELEYENIERIWLERRVNDENGGLVPDATFDLHVIRATEDGTVYEDSVDHLSESEREITGLLFALAGYLAHEVYESMPFLLLDSLEAIDGERIASLIEFVSEYPIYLIVALLPEDAQYVDANHRITNI